MFELIDIDNDFLDCDYPFASMNIFNLAFLICHFIALLMSFRRPYIFWWVRKLSIDRTILLKKDICTSFSDSVFSLVLDLFDKPFLPYFFIKYWKNSVNQFSSLNKFFEIFSWDFHFDNFIWRHVIEDW